MRLPDLPPRPLRRFVGLTVASTVLGMALERVIFWMDVAAIGGAIFSLLGGGSIVNVPKASHEIAAAVREMPSLPPIPAPKGQTLQPSSNTILAQGIVPPSGTTGNCLTAMPSSGATGVAVMTPCAITGSSAGSGGGGAATWVTMGAGGSGGVTNGTVVITYGGGGGSTP